MVEGEEDEDERGRDEREKRDAEVPAGEAHGWTRILGRSRELIREGSDPEGSDPAAVHAGV